MDNHFTGAKRIIWIYPDRGTERQRQAEAGAIWMTYHQIARDVGLEMSLNKPDDITVSLIDGEQVVHVKSEQETPEDTIFITSFWTLPHQTQDVCNLVCLYTILEKIGFYLPITPQLSYITTDKMATMLHLKDSPIPYIPTVRIATGRDAPAKHYLSAVEKLQYPILIKPAYWGMGMGVCVAKNIHDVQGIVGLASGSETALVAQPYLGEGVNDFRVYTVNGEVRTVLRRIPAAKAITASLVNGGSGEYIDLPEELNEAVAYVLEQLPLPYLAIDFLWDGKQFWLSEVEPDGALGYAKSDEITRIQRPTLIARFQAYKDAHAKWIEERSSR